MSHTIQSQNHTVATDCISIWHGPGEVSHGQTLTTGQPFLLLFESENAAWQFVDSLRASPLQWIVGYEQEHADLVAAAMEESLTWVKATPVKHPARDEWALPYRADLVAATNPDIQAGNAQAISDGLSRTPEDMVAEGWFSEILPPPERPEDE